MLKILPLDVAFDNVAHILSIGVNYEAYFYGLFFKLKWWYVSICDLIRYSKIKILQWNDNNLLENNLHCEKKLY